MGVLGHFRDSVTLVNRTSRKLNVRYDGEDITLLPGENAGFPKVVVPYAKNQNPMMGSKHPIDPRLFICLVGVKGTKDDISPISDEDMAIADTKLEVVDREGKFWDEPMRRVQLLRKRGFTAYEAAAPGGGFDNNRNVE